MDADRKHRTRGQICGRQNDRTAHEQPIRVHLRSEQQLKVASLELEAFVVTVAAAERLVSTPASDI